MVTQHSPHPHPARHPPPRRSLLPAARRSATCHPHPAAHARVAYVRPSTERLSLNTTIRAYFTLGQSRPRPHRSVRPKRPSSVVCRLSSARPGFPRGHRALHTPLAKLAPKQDAPPKPFSTCNLLGGEDNLTNLPPSLRLDSNNWSHLTKGDAAFDQTHSCLCSLAVQLG